MSGECETPVVSYDDMYSSIIFQTNVTITEIEI